MSTFEQYSGAQFPLILMGTNGTSGDIIYHSTGSGLTYKSASTGTGVSNKVIGVLVNTTAKGSYGAVAADVVVQMEKHAAANKIEVGDVIYGTKSSNKVGTVAGGTAFGVCVKQSATTDTYVSVRLLPYYVTGAGGFHA
jgi:predicted RecA/RadA family phage recombinase